MPKRPKHPVPAYVRDALSESGLKDAYDSRPPYQRNDYIRWIESAKREETRRKRLSRMLDELGRGDVYMNMAWKPVRRKKEEKAAVSRSARAAARAGREREILLFESLEEWEGWLEENHESSPGIWIKFAKKGSGASSVSRDEALEAALCYGWIDGQADKLDDKYWIVKHTPRGKRSTWSKRNRGIVERLTREGRMRPPGLRKVDEAKRDGRWDGAYDSPANMTIPEDFLKELSRDAKAEAFFRTLNKVNRYAIAWRLQTAKKPETRERRMKAILGMMKRGEKLHG